MKVSIIVASFGSEDWKQRADEAAASVKDASEVLCLHEPQGLVSRVRNLAADAATGHWLCFLDADDALAPGYLAAMEKEWERWQQWRHLRLPLFVPRVSYGNAEPVFPNGGGSRPLLEINWAVVGTLIPARLFAELGGFRAEDEPYEDWALWLRAVAAGGQLVQVPNAIYHARTRPESAHRTRNPRRRRELVATYRRIRAEFAPAVA